MFLGYDTVMWTLHHFFEANLDHFLGNLWYIHIYAHDLCWSCYKNRKLFKVIVPNLCQHWDLKKTQTIDSIGLNPHSKTQTIDPPVKHQKIPVAVGQNQLPRPTSGTSGTSGRSRWDHSMMVQWRYCGDLMVFHQV